MHNINTATMFLPPIYIFSLRDSVRRVERERERERERVKIQDVCKVQIDL